MSSHARTAIVTALLLAATACTSGGDSKPAASPSSTAASLASAWAPNLRTATTGIWNQAGDQVCAEYLTDIALALTDLEQAVVDAGGKGAYPRTVAEIDKANAAVDAYTDHECLGDVNASIQGSPCPDDARVIMSAPAVLQLSLEADEAQG